MWLRELSKQKARNVGLRPNAGPGTIQVHSLVGGPLVVDGEEGGGDGGQRDEQDGLPVVLGVALPGLVGRQLVRGVHRPEQLQVQVFSAN